MDLASGFFALSVYSITIFPTIDYIRTKLMVQKYFEVLNLFGQYKHFALSTHLNPDGDALGSELAIYSVLKELDKRVHIFNSDPTPDNYHFLPFRQHIKPPSEVQKVYSNFSPEVLVVLDAGSLSRIGDKLARQLQPTEFIVNIDHHQTSVPFGDINIIETQASSTSEIVYRIIQSSGLEIGKERAICLYTGLMFDTGCFRYSNSTSIAHKMAADLIEEGVSVDEVYRHVYDTVPKIRLHLLGDVLQTLETSSDGKIAWLKVTQKTLRKNGCDFSQLEGFVNYIRSIDSVEVAIIAGELENGFTKFSLRSKNRVDVGRICGLYGGGGHQKAAGCLIEKPIGEALAQLTDATQLQIDEY